MFTLSVHYKWWLVHDIVVAADGSRGDQSSRRGGAGRRCLAAMRPANLLAAVFELFSGLRRSRSYRFRWLSQFAGSFDFSGLYVRA